LALAAGVLLGAAFPKASVAGFAWLAPGLMLAAGLGASGGGAFRAGYVAGLGFYLSSLSWLLHIPVPFAPMVGWLALSGFLALFPGAWVWLCWRVFPEPAPPGPGRMLPEIRTQALPLSEHLGSFLLLSWRQRLAWSLACAAFWVAWEMFQARIFGGFPWNFLGASQYQMLPLIQIASVTGIYGVSFLMVWFSASLLGAAAVIICQPARLSGSALAEVIVPLLVIVGVAAWGTRVALRPAKEKRVLKIALIQPSIPQTTIWDPNQGAQRFGQLVALTEQAVAATHPELVVWPEAAVPSLFLWDTNAAYQGQTIYDAATGLTRRHKVWLVLGADDAEVRPGGAKEVDYYNSSFLVTPGGKVASLYRKQKLVIFGEYVPLSKWLPFLKDFTQVYGEFAPGKGPVTFRLPSLGVNTTVLICFEDTFPHVARQAVTPDIDFLLNITNNGWFGESAAQWQHAASAVFRAVENGLPLVRAANNGLSCWVDPRGGMHEVFFPGSKDIYKAGFKLAVVPLPERQGHKMTFYHENGDWLGWSCVGLALAALVGVGIRRSVESVGSVERGERGA
jgi:apolipoprotein N-acyltransferase